VARPTNPTNCWCPPGREVVANRDFATTLWKTCEKTWVMAKHTELICGHKGVPVAGVPNQTAFARRTFHNKMLS